MSGSSITAKPNPTDSTAAPKCKHRQPSPHCSVPYSYRSHPFVQLPLGQSFPFNTMDTLASALLRSPPHIFFAPFPISSQFPSSHEPILSLSPHLFGLSLPSSQPRDPPQGIRYWPPYTSLLFQQPSYPLSYCCPAYGLGVTPSDLTLCILLINNSFPNRLCPLYLCYLSSGRNCLQGLTHPPIPPQHTPSFDIRQSWGTGPGATLSCLCIPALVSPTSGSLKWA